MKKEEIIKKLISAKVSHHVWRSYARALVSGLPIDKQKVPVLHTHCDFGKWYYGDGQLLSSLPAFQAIEAPHRKLHSEYLKICLELFGDDCPVGNKNLHKLGLTFLPHSHDTRGKQLLKITEASASLVTVIDKLEAELKSMAAADFESL
jgi:hypothetical protein